MAITKKSRSIDYASILTTDWAYLAGLLDGEGCLRIVVQHDLRHRRSSRHTLLVAMGNTDPRAAVWCRSLFGGAIHYRPARRKEHRPAWVWEVTHIQAEEVLKGCLQYFKLKKEQAEIGLAFRETLKMVKQPKKGIPSEVTLLREQYRLQITALKTQEFESPAGVNSKHLVQ